MGAPDRIVLRLEGVGDVVLLPAFLCLGLQRGGGQRVMVVVRCVQALHGFAHVFRGRLGAWATFCADQHALGRARDPVPVCSQLPSFTTRIGPASVILDPGDVAQRQLAVLVIALELRLYLAVRVVQDQVVAAPAGPVATTRRQFPGCASR